VRSLSIEHGLETVPKVRVAFCFFPDEIEQSLQRRIERPMTCMRNGMKPISASLSTSR
jgi:hypothetical protein